jgi:hypothetical protein
MEIPQIETRDKAIISEETGWYMILDSTGSLRTMGLDAEEGRKAAEAIGLAIQRWKKAAM